MSKITSKNLHYDSTLPPFLARLHVNNSSHDGRHEFTVARPKKARNPEDEAEDEPVYFDEATKETLTKSEWEERQKDEEGAGSIKEVKDGEKLVDRGDRGEVDGGKDTTEGNERIVGIGGSRKRKAGKVVGGEEGNMEKTDVHPTTDELAGSDKKVPSKPKMAKKGKKIKLSFGDD